MFGLKATLIENNKSDETVKGSEHPIIRCLPIVRRVLISLWQYAALDIVAYRPESP